MLSVTKISLAVLVGFAASACEPTPPSSDGEHVDLGLELSCSGTEPFCDFLEFDQWNIHTPPFPNKRLRYNGALPNSVSLMAV